jgi:transposase
MIMVPAGIRVLVATKPVDFRRGADSLAALVREQLRHDPFSGTIFIFRSKRADRLKILAWDGSGLALFWKRLEQGTFRWPPISDGVMRLTASQLAALVDGLDWSRLQILAWDGSGLALFWKRLEPADQRRRDAAHCVAACCPCRWIGLVAPACARRPASDGCIMRCCD